MKEARFKLSEVANYLEEKILNGEANAAEEELYERHMWGERVIRTDSSTTQQLLLEMKKEYGGYPFERGGD
ncbi:hypothetical protein P8825_14715 [Shouchella clausii]|uniref:hypothetical protein n=1 Tax=Shouchella clausii TaxID=79880 RepID=UPI002DBB6D75|nr:hypothetical protein [Shouchella clausii]MEB5480815.1 hypothetical protein [Shouchella clausii]